MKYVILLVVLLANTQVFAHTKVSSAPNRFGLRFRPGMIASTCSAEAKVKPSSPTGLLLEKLLAKFSSPEARVNDPQGFVAGIDSVISKTTLAPILKCREQLNSKPGYKYALEFQDPKLGNQSMQVRSDKSAEGTNIRTLEFNLNKSAASVVFVYLHELTHVCQAPAYDKKVAAFFQNQHDDALAGDILRTKMLGELEAFMTMTLSFSELVQESPKLCDFKNSETESMSLSEGYISAEKDLLNGTFAQPIIFGYMQESYEVYEQHLLKLGAQKIKYADPDYPGQTYQLAPLNPIFKKMIEQIGIPVKEVSNL